MLRWWFVAALLLVASSAPSPAADGRAFQRWLAAAPDRAPAFRRFEALLVREGVADVVPNRALWLTDRIDPHCVGEPFTLPPEQVWLHIVPALRFIRDEVKPAIGAVGVASAFRNDVLNTCIRGAPMSAHVGFYALDLVPRDGRMSRARLIELLCPLHAQKGRAAHIGLGIYSARRFHIDARGYRGWGDDFHRASFPCA